MGEGYCGGSATSCRARRSRCHWQGAENLGLLWGAGLLYVLQTSGQGTFQNLNFESAIVPSVQPGQTVLLPISDVFPGWSAWVGIDQTTQSWYNGVSAGGALVSLIGHQSTWANSVIEGNFTAVLSAGIYDKPSTPVAISQSSLIPVAAQSLRFAALSAQGTFADLAITFNGQPISFIPMSNSGNFTTYGGDISPFAGLTGELRFTERPISNPFSTVFLDDIVFSTTPLPEPGVLTLLAVGTALFGLTAWRRKA
jgi:hypothetical protein